LPGKNPKKLRNAEVRLNNLLPYRSEEQDSTFQSLLTYQS